MQNRTRKILIGSLAAFLFLAVVACTFGYNLYKKVVSPNVQGTDVVSVYIDSDDSMDSVLAEINNRSLLIHPETFIWWAEKKGLAQHLHPGRYMLTHTMSNRDIVNLLMSGRQTPVNVTFNNIRTKYDFAARIGEQLSADSSDFIQYFDTTKYFASAGLTPDNFMTLFIPNTYELYWNTSAEGFVQRMQREHDNFWNASRLKNAEQIGLSPEQVYILASIVYSENEKASEEAPRIAGVYMNRINKNWNLEADPTVKFAIGDFAKKRIYLADLEFDSPYNTYKYPGLPPGPIHMPPIKYIDAVLHYEHHEYMFMCARGDGSGLHYFAKTLAEHNRNRDLYIKALNAADIH